MPGSRDADVRYGRPMTLRADQIDRMTTSMWDQAKAAIDLGDGDEAKARIDDAVARWRSLQEYSINWVTSLLSYIGRELGEEAVEDALRRSGEDFVRARRSAGPDWDALSAERRARAIAAAMVANFGECEVSEDEDKITLSFRCGTGGRLIDEGRYDGDGGYLVLHEESGRTFMRDALPVYCAHCSVNNEIQPVEWGSAPVTVEYPPHAPGEPCVHHIYRDQHRLPDEVYARIGKRPPDPTT
jgi:hypothetical protein